MEMILEYTVTQKDYENVLYSDLQKRLKAGRHGRWIPFIIGSFTGSMLLGMVLVIMFSDEPMFFLPTMILGSVMLIFLWLVTNMRVQARLILRGQIKSGEVARAYFGSHVLEVKDDRLLLRYGDIEGERFYGGIDHIAEYKTAVTIYVSSVSCDIIPNTAFRDAEERRSFISLLQSRMAAAKDVAVVDKPVEESNTEAKYTIDYSWDEQNLINALIVANRAFFKTKLAWTPKRIIMTIIGLFLVGRSVMVFIGIMSNVTEYYSQSAMTGMIILLIIGAALLIQPIMIFTPWIHSIVAKQIEDGAVKRDMIGNHTMRFYDDKIKFFSRLSKQDVSMDQVYGVMRSGSYLFLLSKVRVIFIIPVSAFDSENTLNELIEFVEKKIENKSPRKC